MELAYCVESSLSSSISHILYCPVSARRCRSSTRRRAADNDEAYIQQRLRAFQRFFAVAAQFNSAIFTLGQSHSNRGARARYKNCISPYTQNKSQSSLYNFIFLVYFVLCFIKKKSPKDIYRRYTFRYKCNLNIPIVF